MTNIPPSTPEDEPSRWLPSSTSEQSAAAAPPAVVIHMRGWHLQIDTMPRPPRWLVIWAATLAGSIAGAWGLLAR
jgi:hypothetical protein